MALVTRCPNCETTFRVTAQHLKAHGGDVRCGSCAHVFNGFATLTTVQETRADESSEEVRAVELLYPNQSAVPQEIIEETPGTGNLTIEREYYELSEPHKKQSGWIIASLVLCILLTGQLIYSYRSEISVQVPSARLYLEQYCELLGCTIPPSQQADLLSIESSDLRSDSAEGPGPTTLTAILRNYAPFPQAYPLLELTLTDVQEQTLASHIFKPSEYLGRETRSGQTIAPGQEIEVKVHLDTGDLNAAGYKLFILYP